jgi:predicted amidohydrolase YtcJ
MNAVRRLAPPLATEDKRAALETASNYAASFGVTSVQDVSADDNTEIYRALLRDGKLKTRVYECVALSDWQKLANSGIRKADGDAFLRRGCLKGAADGDADSAARLYEEISAADRAGLQVTVHAVGRGANGQILAIFERVARENGARDRRFRVEHAHRFAAGDLRRFGNSNIIASLQPFLFSDAGGKSLDPLRSLINSRAPLAFGSDASMIPVDPLSGIAAAVNAQDPVQRISVEEAVRFYTIGSAFAEFQEQEKGTIAAGKLADFVILSDDIFTISPDKISRTRVLTTVLDGKIVYQTN